MHSSQLPSTTYPLTCSSSRTTRSFGRSAQSGSPLVSHQRRLLSLFPSQQLLWHVILRTARFKSHDLYCVTLNMRPYMICEPQPMNPAIAAKSAWASLPQSINPLLILFDTLGSEVGATISFCDRYLTCQLLCRSSPSKLSGTAGQQRQGCIDSDIRGSFLLYRLLGHPILSIPIHADKHDKGQAESWKAGADDILVFVRKNFSHRSSFMNEYWPENLCIIILTGLFAAAIATFVVDSHKNILSDSAGNTIVLLTNIPANQRSLERDPCPDLSSFFLPNLVRDSHHHQPLPSGLTHSGFWASSYLFFALYSQCSSNAGLADTSNRLILNSQSISVPTSVPSSPTMWRASITALIHIPFFSSWQVSSYPSSLFTTRSHTLPSLRQSSSPSRTPLSPCCQSYTTTVRTRLRSRQSTPAWYISWRRQLPCSMPSIGW